MRLIDADAFLEEARNGIDMQDVYSPIHIKEFVIDAMPTIDAEPVKHGRWRLSKYYPHIIICSECGEPYELSNSMENWNYCPNCKAKMDEVKDNEID